MYISKDSHPEQAFHCKFIPVGTEAQGGGLNWTVLKQVHGTKFLQL